MELRRTTLSGDEKRRRKELEANALCDNLGTEQMCMILPSINSLNPLARSPHSSFLASNSQTRAHESLTDGSTTMYGGQRLHFLKSQRVSFNELAEDKARTPRACTPGLESMLYLHTCPPCAFGSLREKPHACGICLRHRWISGGAPRLAPRQTPPSTVKETAVRLPRV